MILVNRETLSQQFLLILGLILFLGGMMSFAQVRGSLHEAVIKKDAKQLEMLIQQVQDNGENIDARDFQARTALMIATQQNTPALAKLLIDAGADVNAKNNIQDTPYLLAGAQGYNEILKMTLNHGANIQDTNRYGGTAIIPAAEKGHLETVKILLDAGLDPNHVNGLGWTALMEAVLLGNGSQLYVDIVATLMKGGADPNIPDREGNTPLSYAKKRNNSALIQLLTENGGR